MDTEWASLPWLAAPDAGSMVLVFLLSLRLGGIFLMTPLLRAFGVPPTVRLLVVFGLAFALVLALPADTGAQAMSWSAGQLALACLTELALGATLALGILTAFAAFSLAGSLIDFQVGFGMAQVFDPASERPIPVLTAAFNQLAAVVFFLLNGHHALLRGIAFSLDRLPLGRPWPLEAASPVVAKLLGSLFTLGFALAAPVVVCVLMVELALGVVGRNLPQMNLFVIGIPVKVIVGLMALAVWSAGMGDAMGRIYASIFDSWTAMFQASPAARGR